MSAAGSVAVPASALPVNMDRERDPPIIDLPDDASSWHSAFDSPEDPPTRGNSSKYQHKPKTIKPAKKTKDKKKKKKLKKDRNRVKKDSSHRDVASQHGSSSISDHFAVSDDVFDPLPTPPASSSSSLQPAPCPNAVPRRVQNFLSGRD